MMHRTQISLTADQQRSLVRLAELRGVSQAAVLRDAIDELVDDDRRFRRIAAARASIGAFSSGASAEIDLDAAFVDSIR
jgi:hypothetical protein